MNNHNELNFKIHLQVIQSINRWKIIMWEKNFHSIYFLWNEKKNFKLVWGEKYVWELIDSHLAYDMYPVFFGLVRCKVNHHHHHHNGRRKKKTSKQTKTISKELKNCRAFQSWFGRSDKKMTNAPSNERQREK